MKDKKILTGKEADKFILKIFDDSFKKIGINDQEEINKEMADNFYKNYNREMDKFWMED